MLRYIELTTGYHHDGPAWIANVMQSRSGQTVYFNNQALKRMEGGGESGNHYDVETGDEYWVSGVKKEGGDRHWAGSGVVKVERAALEEYLAYRGKTELDPYYEVADGLIPTDVQRFVALENAGMEMASGG
jgi:hypothetical protein